MRGLSCYTASLHGYLAWEWDACAIIAQTIRLAVRVDLPDGELAFSHHQPSLDLLPDGSCLRYAAAPSPMAALPGVADDLAAHGRVIAVTNSSLLPWSAVRGGRPAPHWVLIDGSDGDRWHVTDMFTALLPVGGEQRPYRGWLDTVPLIEAMTLPARWTPQQGMRNALAFGAAVTVPDGAALWLRRCRERPAALPCAGEWLTTTEEDLRHLAGYLAERGGDGGDRVRGLAAWGGNQGLRAQRRPARAGRRGVRRAFPNAVGAQQNLRRIGGGQLEWDVENGWIGGGLSGHGRS